MYSFKFDSIQIIHSEENLKGNNFLVIWHANKIPPHIGVAVASKYFSLKVIGKDEDLPIHHVFRIAKQKNISVLFIELKENLSHNAVSKTFERYDFASPKEHTCLTPVTALLNISKPINQLSDLLIHLFENDSDRNVFGLNLDENYQGIPAYGTKEIQERLRKLENAKSQKCISKNG